MAESKNLLDTVKRLHFVGIGGSGMCPMAEILHHKGYVITGSDINESDTLERIRGYGIPVSMGHRAENIGDAELVVYTAAAKQDNPELVAAREKGVPTLERSVVLGLLTKKFSNSIAVSGTHGKTTTTSMITHIFMEAHRDPTVMLGGYLPLLKAGHRVGNGDTIIMESCEYCDSFLNFYPTVAIINNIEADHLDYFKDLEAVESSFRKFAGLVPRTGYVIANGDDENTVKTLADLHYISFGIGQKNDVHAENLSEDYRSFDVYCFGKFYTHVHLNVYGRHNVYNALAAAAASYVMSIDGESVALGLASFTGAGRRMEFKGKYHGADIYDDYAHHPGELHALIDAVKTMGYKRIIIAFQPHTYTRTKALFDDFVRELKRVDVAVLAEIYAAREQNTFGISSRDLARQIPNAVYFETLPEVAAHLRSIASEGDVILTVGAGDIYKAGEMLLK